MNKKLYIIITVVAAVILVFWWWSSKQASVQAPQGVDDIKRDLEKLDSNTLDNEFKQIDQDLDNL